MHIVTVGTVGQLFYYDFRVIKRTQYDRLCQRQLGFLFFFVLSFISVIFSCFYQYRVE